jgi:hypothetical protein
MSLRDRLTAIREQRAIGSWYRAADKADRAEARVRTPDPVGRFPIRLVDRETGQEAPHSSRERAGASTARVPLLGRPARAERSGR